MLRGVCVLLCTRRDAQRARRTEGSPPALRVSTPREREAPKFQEEGKKVAPVCGTRLCSPRLCRRVRVTDATQKEVLRELKLRGISSPTRGPTFGPGAPASTCAPPYKQQPFWAEIAGAAQVSPVTLIKAAFHFAHCNGCTQLLLTRLSFVFRFYVERRYSATLEARASLVLFGFCCELLVLKTR